MQVTQIETDHRLMEINCRSTAKEPIRFYLDIMQAFENAEIRWHWHADLEFNVVTRGTILYYVENERYTLSAGHGIWKNANILHMAEPLSADAEMFSVIMNSAFIAPVQSSLYQKYVEPLCGDVRLRTILFDPQEPWQAAILEGLRQSYRIQQAASGAYELRIHDLMCQVWIALFEHRADLPRSTLSPNRLSTQIRLKQMLAFLQDHYAEKLTLEQIAAAANLSKTACMTCFRSGLDTSPIDYLLNYRLEQAMHLLRTSERSIADIGDACGFGDTSYFGKMFRRKTGISPAQYRQGSAARPPC